jgi:hypothetical protein
MNSWDKAVKEAKKRLGIPADSFIIVKGKLLKEAQKIYCGH